MNVQLLFQLLVHKATQEGIDLSKSPILIVDQKNKTMLVSTGSLAELVKLDD